MLFQQTADDLSATHEKVRHTTNSRLMSAIRERDRELASKLVANADVNSQNSLGYTPLMLAVDNQDDCICRLLCEEKYINVNQKSLLGGSTALLNACARGHSGIVKILLLCQSIDVNIQNNLGWTALMYAAFQNHVDIVEQLLTRPDLILAKKDTSGATALLMAMMNENVEIVRLILYADARQHMCPGGFPAKRRRMNEELIIRDVLYRVSVYKGIFTVWNRVLPDSVIARIVAMAFGNQVIVIGGNRGLLPAIETLLLLLR